jgi:hypothetical protein
LVVIVASHEDEIYRDLVGDDARELLDNPPCEVAVAPSTATRSTSSDASDGRWTCWFSARAVAAPPVARGGIAQRLTDAPPCPLLVLPQRKAHASNRCCSQN